MNTRPQFERDGTTVYDPMVAQPEAAPSLLPRSSLGIVVTGAVVAVAVGFALNTLGLAVGAGLVDAVQRDTPSATGMTVGAGAWLLVSNVIGLFIGGLVAGRLSGTSCRIDASYQGLGVWALAFLFAFVVMGQVGSNIAGRAANAVGSAVSGTAQAVGAAAGGAASQVDPRAAIDRTRLALTAPSDVGRMTPEQRSAEIASLVGSRVTQGNLSDADRTRLSRLVAAEAGIPEAEAAQRIQATEAEAQRVAREAEQKAREAADAAATATATSALWFFATMLLGAIGAIIGARTGTRDLVLAHQRQNRGLA
jgi:hypothetical protein